MENNTTKQAVIGIIAQVDAGKSTLAEALLLQTGTIRRAGRVDHGDSHLDTGKTERSRGITIKNKQATIFYKDARLMFVDTPGHADFAAEAERALSVIDYAIFMISATDGIQGQTMSLWHLLQKYAMPTFIFINKTDLAPQSSEAIANITAKLGTGVIAYKNLLTEAGKEYAAGTDESAIEEFFASETLSTQTLQRLVAKGKIFPLFEGAALRNTGVAELLDGICSLLPDTPFTHTTDEFAARVYGISHDAHNEHIAWLKITSGALTPRSEVHGTHLGQPFSGKVGQVREYVVDRYTLVDTMQSGCVCGVTGLKSLQAGDTLGSAMPSPAPAILPTMAHTVTSPDTDAATLYRALTTLAEEDPLLGVAWDETTQSTQLRLMGQMQLEIICSELADRFGITAHFGTGYIPYAETIAAPVRGVGHFEPLRHYAEVHLLLEPLPRGTGVIFGSTCHEDTLTRNWQRLILTNAMERPHKGVLVGGTLTDVRITLVAGKAHLKHTEGGDFRQATYRAIRQALMQADSILLEPWGEFELVVPSEKAGRALSDLQTMSATFTIASSQADFTTITGCAPMAHLQNYTTTLATYTSGQGLLIQGSVFNDTCHNADEVIAQKAYDPLGDDAHTPNSVFCAHGAGYAVAWNNVPAMAHVNPLQTPQKPYIEANAAFFAKE